MRIAARSATTIAPHLRRVLSLGMIAVLCTVTQAMAQQDSSPPEARDCQKDQLSLNICASEKFERADAELNRLYQEQMSYLSSPVRRAALRNAQAAWIAFRDKDCLYQRGPQEDRGSMDAQINADCRYMHTQKRLQDLRKYLACRQNGCPF